MLIYILKVTFIIITIFYQSTANSKITESNNFNHRYLSSYLSGLVSYDHQNNVEALKYFNSAKYLINKHERFLNEYIFLLVENGQVEKAIKEIKNTKNINSTNFFEAKLLLLIKNMKNKNFESSITKLSELEKFKESGNYEYIIFKIIKSYNKLFLTKKIEQNMENFGGLTMIISAFQNCYLGNNKTYEYFDNLVNSKKK